MHTHTYRADGIVLNLLMETKQLAELLGSYQGSMDPFTERK